MDKHLITAFLQYPDDQLVQLAINRANLTHHELEAIQMRELRCLTIEQTAEQLDVSLGTVKNRYNSGISKLQHCWSGIPWIKHLGLLRQE